MLNRVARALAVAGATLATTIVAASPAIRHSKGTAVVGLEITIGLMAGGTGIVNELAAAGDGDAGRGADYTSMTTGG